jgi:hypothetical protein
MALQNPVAVYVAATNVEAQMLKLRLIDAGIEAFVSEDLSTAGLWMLGLLPGIHKPQVWVSQSCVDQARPVLDGYESHAAERRRVRQQVDSSDASPIKVLCEECGQTSLFPSAKSGSIQDCPRCGAYVDVVGTDESDISGPPVGEAGEPSPT